MSSCLFYNYILALAGIIMILAALSDAARFRIPNILCLALILLFPFYVYLAPITVPWLSHLAVFAGILGVGYLLFTRGYAGAGDIKLLASIGLWAGPAYALHFLFITAIAGGILSLGIGALTLIRQKTTKLDKKPSLSKTPIPYGVAISVGGLCTLVLLSHPDLSSLGI